MGGEDIQVVGVNAAGEVKIGSAAVVNGSTIWIKPVISKKCKVKENVEKNASAQL